MSVFEAELKKMIDAAKEEMRREFMEMLSNSTKQNEQEYLTRDEASKQFKISKSTIDRMAKNNKLTKYLFSDNRVLFRKEELTTKLKPC